MSGCAKCQSIPARASASADVSGVGTTLCAAAACFTHATACAPLSMRAVRSVSSSAGSAASGR